MPATILSAAVLGVEARNVTVEVDLQPGLPFMTIVGLPDAAVQETKDRVRSAIKNSGADFPLGRLTVNLSPAEWRKTGTGFDLPVALAILVASGQVPPVFTPYVIVGELGLSGDIRSTTGVVAIARLAQHTGQYLIVPPSNAAEAALVRRVRISTAKTLRELLSHLHDGMPLPEVSIVPTPEIPRPYDVWPTIRGQAQAKRAMAIAAAGHHNVLMIGPPGSGKTLLAQGLRELLPPMHEAEALEVTTIHSVAGVLTPGQAIVAERPFRQPHHTASLAALVGGSRQPRPGEVSLAHHGVLFLDELPEFSRDHLEALRQPLEDGLVTVSRVAGSVRFPAEFMLVAAMNPCPCGYYQDPRRTCHCSLSVLRKYQRRLSGPLLDRFDIFLEVPRVAPAAMSGANQVDDPRPMIIAARQRQIARSGDARQTNSRLRGRMLEKAAELGPAEHDLLRSAADRLHFSLRAYHRVIRLSRTIADLAGHEKIAINDIAEAIQYRSRLEMLNLV